jgi:hypothetical protein
MAEILNTFWLKDIDGGQNEDGAIEHNEVAIIEFDAVVETTPDAIADSLFRGGQVHRSNDFLTLNKGFGAKVHENTNGTTWEFSLTYTTLAFNTSSNDPENYRPKVGYSKWTYSRALYNDKETGDPILLPNGLPYDPPLMESVSSMIIHITVRENAANANRITQCGSVNEKDITLVGAKIPKFCAMFDDYKTEPHRDEEGFLTFFNTYSIKTKFVKNNKGKQIGFKVETLAASFSQLVGGVLEAITEPLITTPASAGVEEVSELVQVSEPVMIDENGAVTTTPFYQERVPFDLISFSQFGLPTSYPVN